MILPVIFALKASQVIFGALMSLTAVFLILLILVQRGKGGGLAGAFGGMGGQSAFGTKAGDTFTRVTIVAATFWILLCVLSVKILSAPAWSNDGRGGTADADDPSISAGAQDTDSTSATDSVDRDSSDTSESSTSDSSESAE